MKKALSVILASLALAVMAASCTSIHPYSADSGATANARRGEASGGYLFGIVPLISADSSISTAAKKGGIKKIATVDIKRTSYLGIVVVRTTIVTGE